MNNLHPDVAENPHEPVVYGGTQGMVQSTYETFAEAGRQNCGSDLIGKWILPGGLGGGNGRHLLSRSRV